MSAIANNPVLSRVERASAPHAKGGGTHRVTGSSKGAWVLFLLLNGSLFMRPAEIVPQLEGLPIYEVNILGCLLLGLPAIVRRVKVSSLARDPITLCVFAMLPAIVLSIMTTSGNAWYARNFGMEFVKIILYYLLLVSLVDSTRRLKQFLVAVMVYAVVLNAVALLRYHHVIELSTVAMMEEGQFDEDADPGSSVVLVRLVAAGIYGNPNDLARIIGVGIIICFFGFSHTRSWLKRLVFVPPLAEFVYALRLTYSRGGLLALLAGIMVLFFARYGWKKGSLVLVVLLPAMLLFGGRQTDISTNKGTAQTRIKLWSDGLMAMRSSPVFGIGRGRYAKVAGNHAHNSFVESFVETGFFGGAVFTSAVFLATMGIYRLRSERAFPGDPELWDLRPFVLALVVGTFVGQLSSSRSFSLPTYMIFGVANAYLALAARQTPLAIQRVSGALLVRLLVVAVCTFLTLHFYTKFNARFES